MSGWEIFEDDVSGATDRAFWCFPIARGLHGLDEDGFDRSGLPIPLRPAVLAFGEGGRRA
jgi:hypothetical protein